MTSKRKILLGPDLLRFLSVVALAWLHGKGPGQNYLEVGIYCLILLSVILPTMGKSRRTFGEFTSQRAQRLLIPYAVFWLAYGLLDVISGKPFFPSLWIILDGHNWHLWYLPYAFIVSVLVYQLNAYLTKLPEFQGNLLLLVASTLTVAGTTLILDRYDFPHRLPMLYLRFAPTIPLGLFIGRVLRGGNKENKYLWLLALITATAGTAQYFEHGSSLDPALSYRYCAALVLVNIAFLWQQGTTEVMQRVTSLAMAVYLLHPAVAFVLLRLDISGLNNYGPLFAPALILATLPVAFITLRTPFKILF
ncbi:MAG: acyltransferase [Thermodesulfobacteriota bacterium]